MNERALRRQERWLRRTPLGRLQSWLVSVPGSLLYNTPAYRLHEELQLHPENRVLDIGCGRASLLQLLDARINFRKPPVGIEVSRTLLSEAKPESSNITLMQAAGTNLPFADGSFDVVTCGYVIHHLEDTRALRLLREIRRVLTPGGIAVIWDFSATGSAPLNAFHKRLLSMASGTGVLRGYAALSSLVLYSGFEWVSNAHLRPFFFPPIPRASVIVGKAPLDWKASEQLPGIVPDTHARSLVAGVTRESLHDAPTTDGEPQREP